MEARAERADVGGDLGRELHADAARREQPVGQRLGERLVRVRGVGDERLEQRDGCRLARARHDLGVARERRDGGEAGLLGQVRHQLEVRVQTRLEPAVGLEQEPLPEHHAGVRLVHAERPFREPVHRRSPAGFQVAQARRRTAHERRRDRAGLGRFRGTLRDGRERRDRPPLGDRAGQRPERAVALRGRAQRTRVGHEREQVRLGRRALVDDVRDRQDVPPVAGEHERLGELDRTDRAALATEPPCRGDAGRIDPPDRVLDGRLRDLHGQISIRIPSAMSHTDHAM